MFRKIRGLFQSIKIIISKVKNEMIVLWYVSKHPGTKWILRIFILFIIAYMLSPIDLIPDFIPVIGYLDDAVLIPLLIFIAFKFVPPDIAIECRNQAETTKVELKKKMKYALLVMLIWLSLLIVIVALGIYVYKH